MKVEIRRQFIHFLFGSAIITLVALRGVQESLVVISTAFIVGLAVSWLIKKGVKIPVLTPIVERVERHYEKHLPGKGALLFFLGAIIAMALFQSQEIVLGALCVAVYGDAASTIVGMRFGRHRIAGKKTLEGTLGGILVSSAFLLALFQWPVALAAAVVGMAAELLPIDDNFTIPVAVGLTLSILI
jgi:dolichol kinase